MRKFLRDWAGFLSSFVLKTKGLPPCQKMVAISSRQKTSTELLVNTGFFGVVVSADVEYPFSKSFFVDPSLLQHAVEGDSNEAEFILDSSLTICNEKGEFNLEIVDKNTQVWDDPRDFEVPSAVRDIKHPDLASLLKRLEPFVGNNPSLLHQTGIGLKDGHAYAYKGIHGIRINTVLDAFEALEDLCFPPEGLQKISKLDLSECTFGINSEWVVFNAKCGAYRITLYTRRFSLQGEFNFKELNREFEDVQGYAEHLELSRDVFATAFKTVEPFLRTDYIQLVISEGAELRALAEDHKRVLAKAFIPLITSIKNRTFWLDVTQLKAMFSIDANMYHLYLRNSEESLGVVGDDFVHFAIPAVL